MSGDMDRRENDKKMYEEISNIKKDNYEMSLEIHSIKKQMEDIVNLMNSLVHKIGNVPVIKNQQENDRDSIKNLALMVKELSEKMDKLNITIAKSEGKTEGISLTVKIVRGVVGSLIFVAVISTVTLLWNMNDRLTILEAGVK